MIPSRGEEKNLAVELCEVVNPSVRAECGRGSFECFAAKRGGRVRRIGMHLHLHL